MRILLIILIGLTGCAEPVDFGNEDWILRWTGSDGDYQDRYFRVDGDTMKVIRPGSFDYLRHLMNLTPDSLTLPNPCVEHRVAYSVFEDQIQIDSSFSILPLKNLTSEKLFDSSKLSIQLANANAECGLYEIDAEVYVGQLIEEPDFNYKQRYFSDDYMLRIAGMFVDSSDVFEWANASLSYMDKPIRIALYIDKDLGNVRTNALLDFITQAFNDQVEFYEGRFAPESEFYLKLKKRKANSKS